MESCFSPSLTTQFVLKLLAKLLDEVKGLHQKDMVFQRGRGHGPQGVHVCSLHTHSIDFNASCSGLRSHFCDTVLGSPICYDHSYSWDLLVQGPCPFLHGKGHIHDILDGQSCHCALCQWDNAVDGLLHISLAEEGLEREHILDLARILDHTHTGGIRPYIQVVNDVNHEATHGLKFERTNAA